MKVELLKKLRKNCHIKIVRNSITFNGGIPLSFIVYSKNFDSSIELRGSLGWLYLLQYWKGYIGCSDSSYSCFEYTRRQRKNKHEFNRR